MPSVSFTASPLSISYVPSPLLFPCRVPISRSSLRSLSKTMYKYNSKLQNMTGVGVAATVAALCLALGVSFYTFIFNFSRPISGHLSVKFAPISTSMFAKRDSWAENAGIPKNWWARESNLADWRGSHGTTVVPALKGFKLGGRSFLTFAMIGGFELQNFRYLTS